MGRVTHRIALISDLHGNAIALRAVLAAIEREGADEIICLGDVATLGVAPAEVVDRVRELRCRCIAGNHDDYLLDPARARAYTSNAMIRDAIDWCRAELSPEQLEFVRGFEAGFELVRGANRRIRLFHGSPRSNETNLLADMPRAELERELGADRPDLSVCGHTHVQMLRQFDGMLLVNAGSVGAPFLEAYGGSGVPVILPHAEWAQIELDGDETSVALRRVALDSGELWRAARASRNPMREALAAPYAAKR